MCTTKVQESIEDYFTFYEGHKKCDDKGNKEWEEQAKKRYGDYKDKDPFEWEVCPSLLNHEQILAYINATGMISPFRPEDLTGITYDARFLGKCVYWEYIEDGGLSNNVDTQNIQKRFKKKIINISNDPNDHSAKRELVIKPNSIVFITLEPIFRIPNYIVLRYNFRIKNVYRGLLLGTGPIIDPGFNGKLSIPIHNLTNNEYTLNPNDAIISIEFTKIRLNQHYDEINKKYTDKPEFKDSELIKEGKWNKNFEGKLEVEDYISKSLKGQIADSVGNSIPAVSSVIEKYSKKVADESEKTASRVKTIGIVGIVGIVIAIVGLVAPTLSAYNEIQKERVDYSKTISSYGQENKEIKARIEELETKIEELEERLNNEKLDSDGCEEMIQEVGETNTDIKKQNEGE